MIVDRIGIRTPQARPAGTKAASAAGPEPAASPSPGPGDLAGLSANAYGALARSYREQGRADLADRFTLEAVKAAGSATEALKLATQRSGPEADRPKPMNQYVRSDAPYVASPEVQERAVALAAARFTGFDEAVRALRSNPAETPASNALMIRRLVDLAADRDQVRDVKALVEVLGTPEAIAYAEAAIETKPKPSFWTRLDRFLKRL